MTVRKCINFERHLLLLRHTHITANRTQNYVCPRLVIDKEEAHNIPCFPGKLLVVDGCWEGL